MIPSYFGAALPEKTKTTLLPSAVTVVAGAPKCGGPHARLVERRVLLHEVEGEGDVLGGERLSIAPLDALPDVEGELVTALPRRLLGQPRRLLAGERVAHDELLVEPRRRQWLGRVGVVVRQSTDGGVRLGGERQLGDHATTAAGCRVVLLLGGAASAAGQRERGGQAGHDQQGLASSQRHCRPPWGAGFPSGYGRPDVPCQRLGRM